jgi:cephalosporin hydroxylase
MRLIIDTIAQKLSVEEDGQRTEHPLYSRVSFELLSQQWLRVGWNEKYPYCFSWFGRPIIQLPEDLIRIQEVIYRLRPDVIVETGVAHGGALVFYATLCKAMDHGRIIGVDIDIRSHNRKAINDHELSSYITLVTGDSAAEETVAQVQRLIRPGEKALVVLDSCHTKEHVRRELEAYHRFVGSESYIVATDGIMQFLDDVPRGRPEWKRDHPAAAAEEFAADHPEFVLDQPPWPFNESELVSNITHWPSAWLRRK